MPAVAIAHTAERFLSFDRVLELVKEALGHLGGVSAFIKPGQTVLIKPDQGTPYPAEQGCTTDPRLVAALIRLARTAGAARILVGDSAFAGFDSLACMRATGLAAAAAREGAELIDLGSSAVPNREVALPEGKLLRHAPLPEPLLDADVVIVAPKARNHYFDSIRGALQAWMGVVNRPWRNAVLAESDVTEYFADLLALLRPDLCVADALVCGEGDGPLSNSPHWCGCILASTDLVAMDVSLARLMGLRDGALQFVRAAEERGLGARAPLVWLGHPLERYALRAWSGHQGWDHLPVNFLAGAGVTWAGTLGHVTSALDFLLHEGVLVRAIRTRGTPTLMVGDVADPKFERHITEGPYIVVDDAARPDYKRDPRVACIGGHPVVEHALSGLLEALDAGGQDRGAERPWTALAAGAGVSGGALRRKWRSR